MISKHLAISILVIVGWCGVSTAQSTGPVPEGFGNIKLGMSENEFIQRNLGERLSDLVPSDRTPIYSYFSKMDVGDETWGIIWRPSKRMPGIIQSLTLTNIPAVYYINSHDGLVTPNILLNVPSTHLTNQLCDRKFDALASQIANRYKKFDAAPEESTIGGRDSGVVFYNRKATMTFPDRVIVLWSSFSKDYESPVPYPCTLSVTYSLKSEQPSPF